MFSLASTSFSYFIQVEKNKYRSKNNGEKSVNRVSELLYLSTFYSGFLYACLTQIRETEKFQSTRRFDELNEKSYV